MTEYGFPAQFTTHYDGTVWAVKHGGITICEGTADTVEEAQAATEEVLRQESGPVSDGDEGIVWTARCERCCWTPPPDDPRVAIELVPAPNRLPPCSRCGLDRVGYWVTYVDPP